MERDAQLLTTNEAAEYLGCSPANIRYQAHHKRITAQAHVLGHPLYARPELDRYAREKGRAGWPIGRPRKPTEGTE